MADEAEGAQKGRGLLHVPSRSSSQKIQSSPTSTGLSGVTVSDPRESIGNRSKESKGSILGKRRDGSANSSKMSITPPGLSMGPVGNTTAVSSKSAKPKKKSFFSMLCCGSPDHANAPDQHEAVTPANKVTKVGARPTTASTPENIVSGEQNSATAPLPTEKEALKKVESGHDRETTQSGSIPQAGANGELKRPGDARDQPLPELPKEAVGSVLTQANTSTPVVVVQAPPRADPTAGQSSSQNERDAEGDVQMGDSEPLQDDREDGAAPIPRRENSVRNTLPPPPPVPQPGSSDESIGPESVDGKQQWLLPPITPRFKGKKCLVLDLDETLVHSSFKVCHSCFIRRRLTNGLRFYIKRTSRFLLKSKGNITTSM